MSINRNKTFQSLLTNLLPGMLLFTSTSHASILLSEVFYDAVGPDTGLAFVELAGVPGSALDGMALEGVNGSNGAVYKRVELAGVMPANGIFLVADDRGDGTTAVGQADQVAGVDFQNGPDSIVLSSFGEVLDALGYGDFFQSVFAGEGRPAPDVLAGRSLARQYPWRDTNDNLADFMVLEKPTPGEAEAMVVPLPPALILMVSGITALLGFGMRKRH